MSRITAGQARRVACEAGIIPAALCHVHHDTAWSHGGHTTVQAGRLLCPRHHTYAHSPTYEMTPTKHGRVTFRRT